MTMSATVSQPTSAAGPVQSTAEAEALVAHFMGVMDRLVGVVERETGLVRAGKLGAATQLAQEKTELSRLYMSDMLRLRASKPILASITPTTLDTLRASHDTFRALLQINLTVLATAHAVSEGIVRGVSGEMARKSMPQTYGSSGRANVPGRNAAAPIAVSRSL
jgi:hypothetical protein